MTAAPCIYELRYILGIAEVLQKNSIMEGVRTPCSRRHVTTQRRQLLKDAGLRLKIF